VDSLIYDRVLSDTADEYINGRDTAGHGKNRATQYDTYERMPKDQWMLKKGYGITVKLTVLQETNKAYKIMMNNGDIVWIAKKMVACPLPFGGTLIHDEEIEVVLNKMCLNNIRER